MDQVLFGIEWWVAIALSVPLSIVGSLLSNWIVISIQRSPDRKRKAKRRQLEREVIEAEHLNERYGSRAEFLMVILILTAAAGAAFGAATALLNSLAFAAQTVGVGPYNLMEVLFFAGTALSLVGFLVVLRLASKGLSGYRRMSSLASLRAQLTALED